MAVEALKLPRRADEEVRDCWVRLEEEHATAEGEISTVLELRLARPRGVR